MSNRNILWGQVFVEELARSGLKAVCVAPGSRHTPLMLAFAKHPDIKVYSHLDERSASFFALGLALASDEPVALVCSSGTAGANMYPAIIEAHQSRVPLIVLTADRPHELRHSGANQTIDQIKMFGDFVLWFVDMQLPEANPPAIAIRNLRTTANRAYAKANGLRKGVVHLNFPFRKPLEPTAVEGDMIELPAGAEARDDGKPYVEITEIQKTIRLTHWQQIGRYADIVNQVTRTLIICGTHCQPGMESNLLNFAYLANIPIVIDSTSGISRKTEAFGNKITGYESYIDSINIDDPELIILFGGVPTSAPLQRYLDRIKPQFRIYISQDDEIRDASHLITHFVQESPKSFCFDMNSMVTNQFEQGDKIEPDRQWYHLLKNIEQKTWQVIDYEIENGAYFDGAVVYDVVDLIPDESTLFVGNSLPVRHLDQFGKPQDKRIYTYANRGASGIDGNISTALGAGSARPDKPLVAIFGDITFYHDMNGLLAVHRCGVPITIVLINNDGGGIFNRLQIKDYEPEFTNYFITPHGLDFSHSAKLYGLDYIQLDAREGQHETRTAFRQKFSDIVGSDKSTIIEIRTDGKFDDARRKEIIASVHKQLETLDL